jgi:hypothetical protein
MRLTRHERDYVSDVPSQFDEGWQCERGLLLASTGGNTVPFSQPPILRPTSERYGVACELVVFRARLRGRYCSRGDLGPMFRIAQRRRAA